MSRKRNFIYDTVRRRVRSPCVGITRIGSEVKHAHRQTLIGVNKAMKKMEVFI
jgi:hypothetical protein